MSQILHFGTRARIDTSAERDAFESGMLVLGELRAMIDPHPKCFVRDIVRTEEGGEHIVRVSATGEFVEEPSPKDREALRDAGDRGFVSWSHEVAELLMCPARVGLPCSPELAEGTEHVTSEAGAWRLHAPGPLSGELSLSNSELKGWLTISTDAPWDQFGLTDDDVQAHNWAVHDFFETAFRHELITRVSG